MKTNLTIFAICMILVSLSLVSAVSIKDVTSSPNEVAPGEVISVTIEIENIFEDDVYNLNVKLDLTSAPFAPYQSSSEDFLDELEEGKEEKFTFKLIALPSASSGIYKFPVEISYEDEDENKSEKTELISLVVNSEPELRVWLDDSAILIRNKENSFSIKIVNSGLADVKFVYLSVDDIVGVRFLTEKEQYIGDIDSDDFDSVEYNIYLDDSASSTINIPVTLKFKDATNKEFIETQMVSLKTYSLKEARELGLVEKPNYIWPVVGIILVGGYFIRRYLKKRKKKLKSKRN